MGLLFKNNAETTLSSGINNSVTTVPVTSAAVFPTPDANNVFFATIDDGTNIEVVKVTAISSNNLTVVRAQDNTSAATFGSGAKIELRLTAQVLDMGTASLTDLDGDTKIQVEESSDEDTIRFDTGGTERMVITSGGDVAIGSATADPLSLSFTGTGLTINEDSGTGFIQVDSGNGSRIDFGIGGSRNTTLYADANGAEFSRTTNHPIHFKTNNTERMRIANDGNVGIGTSSPASPLHVKVGTNNNFEIEETGGDLRLLAINDARNANVKMEFAASAFEFLTGAATFNNGVNATYNGTYQGTIATSAQFGTNGWLNSTDGANRFYFTASSGATYIKINSYIYFQDASTGSNRFSIDGSGNGIFAGNVTAYGSPSDIRLKENVEVIDNALDKVKKLKGITYDLKSDGNRLTGLIAQDLEEVLPEAVYTEKDLETEEEHLAIRYGNTVGLLVEAIKELEARVKELEDK